MKLIEETKTYEVDVPTTMEFPSLQDMVQEVLVTMPKWSLTEAWFDIDAYKYRFTVRKRI